MLAQRQRPDRLLGAAERVAVKVVIETRRKIFRRCVVHSHRDAVTDFTGQVYTGRVRQTYVQQGHRVHDVAGAERRGFQPYINGWGNRVQFACGFVCNQNVLFDSDSVCGVRFAAFAIEVQTDPGIRAAITNVTRHSKRDVKLTVLNRGRTAEDRVAGQSVIECLI